MKPLEKVTADEARKPERAPYEECIRDLDNLKGEGVFSADEHVERLGGRYSLIL